MDDTWRKGPGATALYLLVIAACFAVMAWLNGRYAVRGTGNVALFTLFGVLLAFLLLAVIAGANLAFDGDIRTRLGLAGVTDAVARGFLTVLPFTLLALLAELAFKWAAAPAFMQAAVMTSGAAVGMEVARRAGSRMRYTIVCMAGAFVFSGAWILFSWLFQKAVR